MEQNNEIIFEVMITFPLLLQKKIEEYNLQFKTNFELVEIINDEVQFCKVRATKYQISDVFDLGYSLAAYQYTLKMRGEIEW